MRINRPMDPCEAKRALRKEMALRKKNYPKTRLFELSGQVLKNLEEYPLFRRASCIACYHALPDEVQTAAFIRKWYGRKKILLPVVVGDELRLRPYEGDEQLQPGAFGILEPKEEEQDILPEEIDLMIVPGVAFDRQNNRLGRGKGYYDRLLGKYNVPTVGICFDFQLLDKLPCEPFDRKMDKVITETQTDGRNVNE